MLPWLFKNNYCSTLLNLFVLQASLVSRIATSVKSWWSWSSNSEVENVNIGTTSVQNGDRKSIDKVYEVNYFF